jgi:hypothetical protein
MKELNTGMEWMKLLVNENWIDLDSPIYMTEGQRNRLIDFFRSHFGNVEVVPVEEATKEFGPREVVMKEWTEHDLLELLSSKDNDALAREMDRTIMSVKMKRGSFVPNFWKWMRDRGRKPPADLDMVREFVKEVSGR